MAACSLLALPFPPAITLDARTANTLAPNTAIKVMWPSRKKPKNVVVDGQPRTNQTADGISLEHPFEELVAQW